MSPWYFRPRNEAERVGQEIWKEEHKPKNHGERCQFFLDMWLAGDYQFMKTEAFMFWLDSLGLKVID